MTEEKPVDNIEEEYKRHCRFYYDIKKVKTKTLIGCVTDEFLEKVVKYYHNKIIQNYYILIKEIDEVKKIYSKLIDLHHLYYTSMKTSFIGDNNEASKEKTKDIRLKIQNEIMTQHQIFKQKYVYFVGIVLNVKNIFREMEQYYNHFNLFVPMQIAYSIILFLDNECGLFFKSLGYIDYMLIDFYLQFI